MRIDRKKLAFLMFEKEMTTKDLHNKCGVSRQTLCYIRNGKSCALATAVKIAAALGVEVTELLED